VLLEHIETTVKIGERTFTLKQIIDATKKFSPKMELGSGRSGIVYRVKQISVLNCFLLSNKFYVL
jgi:hypothetical protein